LLLLLLSNLNLELLKTNPLSKLKRLKLLKSSRTLNKRRRPKLTTKIKELVIIDFYLSFWRLVRKLFFSHMVVLTSPFFCFLKVEVQEVKTKIITEAQDVKDKIIVVLERVVKEDKTTVVLENLTVAQVLVVLRKLTIFS
jgi:hypothetical protein